jgi:hypothetical protein
MADIVILDRTARDPEGESPPDYPAEVLEAGWVPELAELAALKGVRPPARRATTPEDTLWSEAASA